MTITLCSKRNFTDVIEKQLRQVVTATNDGAIAAQHAFHVIKGL